MYCSNCGKEIADDEKFCHNCGSETALNTNKQNYQDVRSFTNTNVIRCRFCDKFIPEKSVGCPYCGNIVNPQMGQASHNPNPQAKNDSPSFLWGLFAFILPLAGIVLYLLWHKEYPERCASILKGIIVCIVLGVISGILATIIYFVGISQYFDMIKGLRLVNFFI